jgi:uncharacterized protein
MRASKTSKCPTCNRAFDPLQSTAMPFCSPRCRQIDLGRWLGEEYGLPVVPNPEADEEPEGFPGDSPAESDEN